jgi:hypothetical protein
MKLNLLTKIICFSFLSIFSCLFLYALDDKGIKGNEEFAIQKTIPAIFLESTDKKEKGEKIYFLDLDTDEPKVLFYDTESRSPFKKIYEDDDTIVIQLVASATGSIDTFIIAKKNGKFVRLSGGNVMGLYGDVSFGVCK